MSYKPKPVDSVVNLRNRVARLFKEETEPSCNQSQLSFNIHSTPKTEGTIDHPTKTIENFLNFISCSLSDGDIYLFGGLLRDLAFLGRRGFNSDIDIVVEGNWDNCVNYLNFLKADKNKFGGYRLNVSGWPIDIWNARETWAIKQGFVQYKSIASLNETTVLNWDAILMNWRTRAFICHENYFEEMKSRKLNIVLENNPDPLGMAVRVFRHLCWKDAKQVTTSAAEYLVKCTKTYSLEDIKNRENRSYDNSVIEPNMYKYFENLSEYKYQAIDNSFSISREELKSELWPA